MYIYIYILSSTSTLYVLLNAQGCDTALKSQTIILLFQPTSIHNLYCFTMLQVLAFTENESDSSYYAQQDLDHLKHSSSRDSATRATLAQILLNLR
jgi:hypothetical protein